ncbi:pentatricopeptide repeat-containing protein At1g09190 [Amborella trichopoda]|uniref:pentatricopeptide repeat-containing protein At1g09190 n=1 Tax=Amborella trichopoda TaxID=13333 RepID=UPI0009C1115B|nr:pentatricopeptide repeat-containing protein At1g09190 [Amborella trichopoda]|eukprot:XP_011627371.2 pentatricopeptide repeat-containing protein At1g09190 [Amborella trichopoda]
MSRAASRQVQKRILTLLHGRNTRTHLSQIHAHIIRHNLQYFNLILSHFVPACASSSKMSYARQMFDQVQNPNIYLFNSMFRGYFQSGSCKEALSLYNYMLLRGVCPDAFTFPPLLRVSLSSLKLGSQIHGQILRIGFEKDGSVGIGLVELYATRGSINDAHKMFNEIEQRDVVAYNMMICRYCREGDLSCAFALFDELGERKTVVSWNAIIGGYAQRGRHMEALEIFREMFENGNVRPDNATIVTVLPVCAHLGSLDVGRSIHNYAKTHDLMDVVNVSNALIDLYAKCGDLSSSRVIFDEMPKRNVVSWNAMISGLAVNGHAKDAISLFEEMKREKIEPNEVTFIALLNGCTHAGMVQTGRILFTTMLKDHGIEPKVEHYGCMVDLLGRSGFVEEAHELIKAMPMKPNAAIFGAFLSACRIHGQLSLAEYAAKKLVEIEHWNPGNYVLLSNVYAGAGKWDEVEKVREMMRDRRVQKAPGWSLIEVNGEGL